MTKFIVHDLLDHLKSNNDKASYDKCLNSVKFHLGECDDIIEMSVLSEQISPNLPAKSCLFQIQEARPIFIYAEDDGSFITYSGYIKTSEKWMLVDYELKLDKETGEVTETDVLDIKDIPSAISIKENPDILLGDKLNLVLNNLKNIFSYHIKTYVNLVSKAINVFSCSNVVTKDNHPSRIMNDIRLKKGKTPHFSYKTLHIRDSYIAGSGTDATGRKHESPRLHLRRGHIRTYKNGMKIWVQSCLVGDKSKGVIVKDYKVLPRNKIKIDSIAAGVVG